MKYLILLGLLAACGRGGDSVSIDRLPVKPLPPEEVEARPIPRVENDPRPVLEIDADLLPWVEDWEELSGKPIDFPVYFVNIDEEDVLGVCVTWCDEEQIDCVVEVRIDRTEFEASLGDPIVPQTIMRHEFGHCALGRPHTSLLAQEGNGYIPYSIMFPQLVTDRSVYARHDYHYVQELFGGRGYLRPIGNSESYTKTMTMKRNGFTGIGILD